jgi:predicted secreted protein
MRRISWIALAFLLLFLPACGATGGELVTLHEGDANKVISLHPTQKLEVVLEGNPTTGYQWQLSAGDPTVIVQKGDPSVQPSSTAVGAGGTVTTHFQAVAAGQTLLTLVYRRPFEDRNIAPAKVFEVTVSVQ